MEYSQVTKAVIEAVKGDQSAANKWQSAGATAREFFGTESAMREVKAQFIADAIVPALDKKHGAAMAVDLPRKGSADYVKYIGAHGAEHWENANKAKKDARATADTMFNRVIKYAFPAEKAEKTVTETKTKLVELINDAIKRAQKDTSPDYDVSALVAHLNNALAVVNK